MLANAPVRVLDSSLTLLAEITMYQSLYYIRGWNSPGQFELKINYNIFDKGGFRSSDYFQKDRFIMVAGDFKKFGIIKEVSKAIDENGKGSQWVTVKGYEASSILSWRLVEPPSGYANYTSTAVAETLMKALVTSQAGSGATANRQISLLNVVATAGAGASYTYSSRYKNLAEDLREISTATAIGWYLTYNPTTTKLDFDCAAGVDRTATQSTNTRMIVSTDYNTLKSGKLTDSNIVYKNIVYAAGQGVGDQRNVRKVYDTTEPTGFNRRECFVDMRDLVADADIDARGASTLSANAVTKFIDASQLSYTQYVIGVDYDLGDYITLDLYDETNDVQITAIKESWSAGKYNIDLTFNRSYPELPTQIRSNNQDIGMALANSDGVMVGSGSASSGKWVKFSDGTMIQWGLSTQNISVTNSVGSGYYGLGSAVTFPIAFVGSNPSLNVSGSVLYATSFSSLSTTQFTINATYFASTSGSYGYTWIAIGRWKT